MTSTDATALSHTQPDAGAGPIDRADSADQRDHLLALVDPDSDLADRVRETGTAVVQLLEWPHRDLAEAFAGLAPAPGGMFTLGSWDDTEWGPLDYLIIDMPPGTGDIALTLSQLLPLTGAVVVCTPQDVALLDATKAIAMFRKVNIPVAGMVENMSGFVCPDCNKRYDIFGSGGAKQRASDLDVPFHVIAFTEDVQAPPQDGREMADLLPRIGGGDAGA